MIKNKKTKQESILYLGLSHSQIFLDYQNAFRRATGFSLSLRSSQSCTDADPEEKSNSFCSLMAQTNQSCTGCYALQKQLEEQAQLKPKTLKCFAGLCETALPVRVGENLVAYLQTGQVFVDKPTRRMFNHVVRTLLSWGTQVDVKKMEERYFNIRVVSPEQYEAIIELLKVFAQHLAECGDKLALEQKQDEPETIRKAKTFIQQYEGDDLSLGRVAQVVNVSSNYFSELFKKAAGMNFTDYVSRVRIEKAKHLLENPQKRISEVAFDVGFQSLSQFNRVFKKVTGQAPKELRRHLSRKIFPTKP